MLKRYLLPVQVPASRLTGPVRVAELSVVPKYTAYVTSARCVIPEAPYDLDALCALLAADHAANPSHYAFVVTAEGAIWRGAQMTDVGGAEWVGARGSEAVDLGMVKDAVVRDGDLRRD